MTIKYTTMTHNDQKGLDVFEKMETTKMTRDWKKEANELKEQFEWVNLHMGSHKVVFLDNGEDRDVFFDDQQ